MWLLQNTFYSSVVYIDKTVSEEIIKLFQK